MTDPKLTPIGPERKPEGGLPVVLDRGGVVMASSRDVAEFFGKEHRNVLQSIDNLLKDIAAEKSATMFREIVAFDDGANRDIRHFEMTRDGFTLLAMGFNGQKALQFKLAYIDAFNRMEAALKKPAAPMIDATDPAQLRLLALQLIDVQERLQADIKDLTPRAEGYDRLAVADGSFCITDAAKTLQIRRKDLIGFMQSQKWIYRRPGNGHWVGYQDKIQGGHLEHKVTEITHADGSSKITEQVRVTGKGLTRLARDIGRDLVPAA